jgi:D-threo-aldose 1-dehydrogenase
LSVFENACKSAFRTLDCLQDTEAIKARGLGVSRVKPIKRLLALQGAQPDGVLLAGRYTLLEHGTRPTACDTVGGGTRARIRRRRPLWPGPLAGGPNFEYALFRAYQPI